MEDIILCREKLEDADAVLIGFGKEFNINRIEVVKDDVLYNELDFEKCPYEDYIKDWIELSIMYDCLNTGRCDIIKERKALYDKVHNYLISKNIKNYFVVTTCFDDIIMYSAFEKDRLVAPCGTLGYMKCDGGCFKHVYETVEVFDNINSILKKYKDNNMINTKEMWDELEEAMPQCPMCKRVMSINIVKTNNYSEEGYKESWESYMSWLQKTVNRKLVMLELGEGFETPTVIRWPFEKVATVNNKAVLVRVNDKFWQVSEDIEEKAITVKKGGIEFIKELIQ